MSMEPAPIATDNPATADADAANAPEWIAQVAALQNEAASLLAISALLPRFIIRCSSAPLTHSGWTTLGRRTPWSYYWAD